MSTTKRDGTKISLPRTGPDQFWQTVHDYYAGDDRRKWKYLAMLALRENSGWPLDKIGQVFGHPKGHVTRCLERIKGEMREQFKIQISEEDELEIASPILQQIPHNPAD